MPEDYEPPPEIETTMKCPVCGKNLFLIYFTTTIPYEGKIVINTYVCHNCMYKNPQVYSEGQEKKEKITLRITEPDDLSVLVYRSPKASIIIPELDAEILPGDDSRGDLTTVEGILLTIYDRLDLFMGDQENENKINAIRNRLSNVKESAIGLTIIIQDDSGLSRINSPKSVSEFF
ncbi:MAG: ZPR1 zinc finger domain-containing protein [Candidatus Thermoplasmatota archaeon]|nr:ZPR1 zinc finger domain-containing protein [Candidatus Thermoplasmatota archaeon]